MGKNTHKAKKTKYSRKKYSAIASLRILVYIEFRAKVYGERGKYTVRSLQANMDGDEGELVRFEKKRITILT